MKVLVSQKTVTVEQTEGLVTQGASSVELATNYKAVRKFTLTSERTITKLILFSWTSGCNMKAVIYSDNAGAPNALLGISDARTTDHGPSYYDLVFSTPVYLSPGTYWMGIIEKRSVVCKVYYDVGDTNEWAQNADDYDDGPSNPFGAPSYYARRMTLFFPFNEDVQMKFPPSIEGNTVTTSPIAEAIRWQQKCFGAEGRLWLFYADGYSTKYITSTNGVTWDTPILLGLTLTENMGEALQAILETKAGSNYVHVFAITILGIYYRRGLLVSDGSISWTAAWNLFWTFTHVGEADFCACLDSNGYPYVIWGWTDDGGSLNVEVHVNKSDRNDGIWQTAAGYPILLSTVWMNKSYWNTYIVPLSQGKIAAFYMAVFGQADPIVKCRIYDGFSWGAEENCTTHGLVGGWLDIVTYNRSIVVDSNDNIHFFFYAGLRTGETKWTGSGCVYYVKRTWGVGWGSEIVVGDPYPLQINEADVPGSRIASPVLCIQNNDLYLFWIKSAITPNVMIMKILDSEGWWSNSKYLIDETTDKFPLDATSGYDGIINSFPQLYNDKIGLFYMTKTANPFTIKFAIVTDVGIPYPKTDTKLYNSIKEMLRRQFNTSVDVSLASLILSDRDTTTGWYAKEWAYSNIEMLIVPKDAQRAALQIGYFVSLDGLGFTISPVHVYDKIYDAAGKIWEIKTVKPQTAGDVFFFYLCDLKELPLNE